MKKYILLISVASLLKGTHQSYLRLPVPKPQHTIARSSHDEVFITDYSGSLITNHYRRHRQAIKDSLATQSTPTRICLNKHLKTIDSLYANQNYTKLQKALHEPFIELFLSFYDPHQLLDFYYNRSAFQPCASAAHEDAINNMYATLSNIAVNMSLNTPFTVQDIPYRLSKLKLEICIQENYPMNKNERFLYEQLKYLHSFYTEKFYAQSPI